MKFSYWILIAFIFSYAACSGGPSAKYGIDEPAPSLSQQPKSDVSENLRKELQKRILEQEMADRAVQADKSRLNALHEKWKIEDRVLQAFDLTTELRSPECLKSENAEGTYGLIQKIQFVVGMAKNIGRDQAMQVSDSLIQLETQELQLNDLRQTFDRMLDKKDDETVDDDDIQQMRESIAAKEKEKDARISYFRNLIKDPQKSADAMRGSFRMRGVRLSSTLARPGADEADLRYFTNKVGHGMSLTGDYQDIESLEWNEDKQMASGRILLRNSTETTYKISDYAAAEPLLVQEWSPKGNAGDIAFDFWWDFRKSPPELLLRESDKERTKRICGTETEIVWKSFNWDTNLRVLDSKI